MRRFAIALLVVAAACSPESQTPPVTTAAETTATQQPNTPPLPSADETRELIANSPAFGEYEFTNAAVSIPVSGAMMNEVTRGIARDLAQAGWIDFDGAGDIMLNAKSRNDKRFLLRANGILDVVPLAKKEMGDMEAIRANPDGTASANFTWHWVPNEVGAAINTNPVADRFKAAPSATATLIWDGTSWSVLKIDAR